MKTIGKTRIIRLRDAEVFFKRIELGGEQHWLECRRDTSALLRHCHDKTFKTQSGLLSEPKTYGEPLRPVPDDYGTALLSPYAANEYAIGHEPLKPLRLR